MIRHFKIGQDTNANIKCELGVVVGSYACEKCKYFNGKTGVNVLTVNGITIVNGLLLCNLENKKYEPN